MLFYSLQERKNICASVCACVSVCMCKGVRKMVRIIVSLLEQREWRGRGINICGNKSSETVKVKSRVTQIRLRIPLRPVHRKKKIAESLLSSLPCAHHYIHSMCICVFLCECVHVIFNVAIVDVAWHHFLYIFTPRSLFVCVSTETTRGVFRNKCARKSSEYIQM